MEEIQPQFILVTKEDGSQISEEAARSLLSQAAEVNEDYYNADFRENQIKERYRELGNMKYDRNGRGMAAVFTVTLLETLGPYRSLPVLGALVRRMDDTKIAPSVGLMKFALENDNFASFYERKKATSPFL